MLRDRPRNDGKRRYVLRWWLPDGSVKRAGPLHLIGAQKALVRVLNREERLNKRVAARFALQLARVPVGSNVEAHGHRFQLVKIRGAMIR